MVTTHMWCSPMDTGRTPDERPTTSTGTLLNGIPSGPETSPPPALHGARGGDGARLARACGHGEDAGREAHHITELAAHVAPPALHDAGDREGARVVMCRGDGENAGRESLDLDRNLAAANHGGAPELVGGVGAPALHLARGRDRARVGEIRGDLHAARHDAAFAAAAARRTCRIDLCVAARARGAGARRRGGAQRRRRHARGRRRRVTSDLGAGVPGFSLAHGEARASAAAAHERCRHEHFPEQSPARRSHRSTSSACLPR